jgi:hypothetical protein
MNDNDEERVIVEVPAHEPEPQRVLITRRILIWAVVIGVMALLAGMLLDRPDYVSKTVPEVLVGEWTCELPEYSDRYLTLTPSSITFGTGGTSFVTYKILGVEKEQVEGVDTIILHFRDVAGTKFQRSVVADPSGSSMHFASQPAVVWQRFGQSTD